MRPSGLGIVPPRALACLVFGWTKVEDEFESCLMICSEKFSLEGGAASEDKLTT